MTGVATKRTVPPLQLGGGIPGNAVIRQQVARSLTNVNRPAAARTVMPQKRIERMGIRGKLMFGIGDRWKIGTSPRLVKSIYTIKATRLMVGSPF